MSSRPLALRPRAARAATGSGHIDPPKRAGKREAAPRTRLTFHQQSRSILAEEDRAHEDLARRVVRRRVRGRRRRRLRCGIAASRRGARTCGSGGRRRREAGPTLFPRAIDPSTTGSLERPGRPAATPPEAAWTRTSASVATLAEEAGASVETLAEDAAALFRRGFAASPRRTDSGPPDGAGLPDSAVRAALPVPATVVPPAIVAFRKGDVAGLAALARAANDPDRRLALEWAALRADPHPTFAALSAFAAAHPGWPGEGYLRFRQEADLLVHPAAPADVLAFYGADPPPVGGRPDGARPRARRERQGRRGDPDHPGAVAGGGRRSLDGERDPARVRAGPD